MHRRTKKQKHPLDRFGIREASEWTILMIISLVLVGMQAIPRAKLLRKNTELQQRKECATRLLADSLADQKTGCMAVSILSELSGWQSIPPEAQKMMQFINVLPRGVTLNQMTMDQALMSYPLPAEMQYSFVQKSLLLSRNSLIWFDNEQIENSAYMQKTLLSQLNEGTPESFYLLTIHEEDAVDPSAWAMLADAHEIRVWNEDLMDRWMKNAGIEPLARKERSQP